MTPMVRTSRAAPCVSYQAAFLISDHPQPVSNAKASDSFGGLALRQSDYRSLGTAANPVLPPKAKPRAVREHFVMPSIRSREVVRTQRSSVRLCEDALQPLDFGNSLLGVHSVSISTIRVAMVKRSVSARSPAARGAILAGEDQEDTRWR